MKFHLWLCVCGSLVSAACSTLPNGDTWGDEATYRPGWERITVSARHAARDPWVWIPLLGTGFFQVDDWDRKVSDWAREHTPVFGSQESAEDWSDTLRSASTIAFHASVLATPSGADPAQWLENKARGYVVEGSAIWLTSLATQELKATTDRERPNGLADESFPSGHTSASAVHTRLASRNLRALSLQRGVRRALDAGLVSLTFGTSWARIEAGWHYPSDTLFSMALGNFLAAFIHDAFMGLESDNLQVGITLNAHTAEVRLRLRF